VKHRHDPHADQPILRAGPQPERRRDARDDPRPRRGRESILSLYRPLGVENIAALAPEAAGATWYPHSFLAPLDANQPYLDSALRKIDSIVTDLIAAGVPSERIALLGFSQGACLTSEFVARHPRRYGAVMALTAA
jgi:predicted esterase